MIEKIDDKMQAPWPRPQLERSRPVRTAGAFYRTAEGAGPGVGGVPLVAAQDAVVAAVRMAYKVAEAQIDRSARLARRLRDAGDRAVGARSDRKAVDATEQLIFRAMMSALAWLEGTAADPDPVKRLMTAQYRLAGSILGLTPSEAARTSGRDSATAAPRSAEAAAASPPQPPGSNAPAAPLTIVLKGASKRPVRPQFYQGVNGKPAGKVLFYSTADIKTDPLPADFIVDDKGRGVLSLDIAGDTLPGVWRGAICDDQSVQIGLIEIEL
jgi:hypothetical protein